MVVGYGISTVLVRDPVICGCGITVARRVRAVTVLLVKVVRVC